MERSASLVATAVVCDFIVDGLPPKFQVVIDRSERAFIAADIGG
jgi:hypothetical protein